MSLNMAKEYLKKFHLEQNIIEFQESTATVRDAALALGCMDAQIAKTMAFLVDDKPILIVASGDKKIDNSKFKQTFHTKAKMIPSDELLNLVGHAAGGVCPFGIKDGVLVYLDVSLKEFDTVYPACGTSNSAVKLTIPLLEEASNYIEYIDVCKKLEV